MAFMDDWVVGTESEYTQVLVLAHGVGMGSESEGHV